MPRNKSWDQIRREIALTDAEIEGYEKLDALESRLADALGQEAMDIGRDDDLYLFELARHIATSGGRLELRAVFPDREVLLLSEPEPDRHERPPAA